MNFKKISAIASSVLLASMSVGIAAAASYPNPFVSGGSANVAVVYGTGVGASASDLVQANEIETDLLGGVTSTDGVTTVSGGESFTLEKSSNMFNFNNALNAVHSSLDDEEMDFLADGTYDDGDIDEDYEQTITLGSKQLSLFADPDYNDDEPTVGFRWVNNDMILSYTIEFDDDINLSEMVDTNFPLLGAEYYVLAASSSQIDILDSSEKTSIDEGEVITVKGKVISIAHVESGKVRLEIDGETTDKLAENEYEKLDDGTYVVITAVDWASKETGISSIEFSIGNGKMELIFDDEVQVNDKDVDGLVVTKTNNTIDTLDSLTITWNSDRETFLTEENSITMPGFNAISVVYEGLDYPDDSEVISFDNGETLTLKMDNYELPLMWWNGTDAFLGEENALLVLAVSDTNFTGWSDNSTATLNTGLELTEGDVFLVTIDDDDLSNVETMYYEVSTIDNDSSGSIEVIIEDLIGDNSETFDSLETRDAKNIDIELIAVDGVGASGKVYLNFSSTVDVIRFDTSVSDTGLELTIPTDVSSLNTSTGVDITLIEADDNEDLGKGISFKVTIKATDGDNLHVSTHNVSDEEDSNDLFVGVVPSDLASKVTFDKSGDENDFEVEYFAKEVGATVKIVVGGESSTDTSSIGNLVVKDSEVDSVSDKNLVIVGGSCINSAAATALDVANRTCGAAFTAATGVGTGQFLIQVVEDVFSDGKIALVVAGWETADTEAAATYLMTQDISTLVGKEVIASSSMEAVIVQS